MSQQGTGGNLPDWYPAPLSFPDGVGSVVGYVADAGPSLAKAASSLDPAFLRSLCGRSKHADDLIVAQRALTAGRFSEAIRLVAPFYYQHLHAAAVYSLAAAALLRLTPFAAGTIALQRMLGADERPSLYRSLAAFGSWIRVERPDLHPEVDAMAILCDGTGIDVGCGSNKTVPWAIGVDLTPGGEKGAHGCQADKTSLADVASSGDDLPMFADGALDFVVARRNYEHYQDPVAPLMEWARVLKPGGRLGIVTPDHDWVDSITLDPANRHAFNPASLARLVGLVPGLTVVWSGAVIPRWSAGVVAIKEGGADYDYREALLNRELARLDEAARSKEEAGRRDEALQCRLEAERIEKEGV